MAPGKRLAARSACGICPTTWRTNLFLLRGRRGPPFFAVVATNAVGSVQILSESALIQPSIGR